MEIVTTLTQKTCIQKLMLTVGGVFFFFSDAKIYLFFNEVFKGQVVLFRNVSICFHEDALSTSANYCTTCSTQL